MPRRARSSLALLVTAGILTSACSSPAPDPAPPPAPPVTTTTSPSAPARPAVVVNAVEPRRAMLPADISDEYGARIGALLYRGLTRYDAKGRLVMEVADSVEAETPTRYRIRLRNAGWSFTNGELVTARSFVDAWNFAANPAHAQTHADAFRPIAGYAAMRGLPEPTPVATATPGPTTSAVTTAPAPPPTTAVSSPPPTTLSGLAVVSDLEFTVTLAAPDPAFPQRLAELAYAPLPSAALKDPAAFSLAPLGNGPYQLAGGWVPGKEVRLLPNASYQGSDAARNGGVTFRFSPDPSLTYPALLAGALDVLDAMPVPALSRYKADLGFRAANQSVGAIATLVFPMARPEWAGAPGLAVRRAISRSIDRPALTAGLLAGTAVPATDLTSPTVDGYTAGLCGETCTADVAAARAALAGVTPQPLTILYGADGGGKPIVEALCASVTITGIPCTATPVPHEADLVRAAALHQLTAPAYLVHRMERPEIGGFLDPRFRAGSAGNPSGYASPAAQALLTAAAQKQDAGARREAYLAAERAILDDLPEIPLWYVNTTLAGSTAMEPVRFDVFGRPLYAELSRS